MGEDDTVAYDAFASDDGGESLDIGLPDDLDFSEYVFLYRGLTF